MGHARMGHGALALELVYKVIVKPEWGQKPGFFFRRALVLPAYPPQETRFFAGPLLPVISQYKTG